MDLFKKMVERKRPHIIGLCAESLEATRLKKDLEQAIGEMLSQETITQNIEVAFIECDAAKVFMNSKQAIVSLPFLRFLSKFRRNSPTIHQSFEWPFRPPALWWTP